MIKEGEFTIKIIFVDFKMKNSQDKVFRKVDRCIEKISKKFPDIPIHDLRLIILNLLKPKVWPRRFLLRKIGNKYVS